MNLNRKLKPNFLPYIFAVALIIALILFIRSNVFGEKTHEIILVALFSHATFNQCLIYLRTRNWHFIPFILIYAFTFLFNLFLLMNYKPIPKEYAGLFLFPFGALLLFVFIILIARGINPLARAVLESSAQPIKESADGFTTRPYPLGQINGSQKTIRNFAKFCMNKLITVSYFVKDGAFLVIDTSEMKLASIFKVNFQKQTYVYFDYSGQISVNIAKKDYKKFKEELTFDQLCASLGNLFVEFLELHKKGEGSKIIDQLKR